ncbi:hypothetical protein CVT24_007764 [Panaeolus cyanescens]|uniref:Calcineurin-like phosphoesterase domain-containing protein n=1 Tax=Panaeolus cyanescens TaxID=181874 RepID=A0A409YKT6_9AGAR|nr:hypothetical protein CVT24_007764 [Panaeolus cyanescens]
MISRSILFLSVLSGAIALPHAKPKADGINPYPDKPRVVFKPDGTFKVTVFSDLHFGENPWDWWGPEHDASSVKLMQTVLADEKPDYAVLNGDLITGENTFRENSTTIIDIIVGPLNDAKVPFSSTHGNHDNQPNITHLEETQREQLVAPLSYTRVAPNGVGGAGGPGNYWVPVYRNANGDFSKTGGFSTGQNPVGVPDWVDATVGEWIKSETTAMEAAWGPSEKRGALAFVHIPPHSIQALQATITPEKNPGLNGELLIIFLTACCTFIYIGHVLLPADLLGVGSIQASGDLSNGKDDRPFWDSLNTHVKNLHAVISGHDHGNEWCAREPEKDVIFCFDKHAGFVLFSVKVLKSLQKAS